MDVNFARSCSKKGSQSVPRSLPLREARLPNQYAIGHKISNISANILESRDFSSICCGAIGNDILSRAQGDSPVNFGLYATAGTLQKPNILFHVKWYPDLLGSIAANSGAIRGRPIAANADSPACYDQIQQWIRECIAEHSDTCPAPLKLHCPLVLLM